MPTTTPSRTAWPRTPAPWCDSAALLPHHTALEPQATVRPSSHGGVVRDDHHREPLGTQALHQLQDLVPRSLVEIPRRLVGEEDPRLLHERARDRHTLLLTAGEFTGSMVRALGEVDLRQRRADPFFPLGTRESQRLESDVDVLRRGEGGDEVERLEHEPDVLRSDARERGAGLACQIRFSEEDTPRCRGVEGTENLEKG